MKPVKLCRVAHISTTWNSEFVKDIETEIIYANYNQIVEVYEDCNDPYAIYFYGTDKECELIQTLVDANLTAIAAEMCKIMYAEITQRKRFNKRRLFASLIPALLCILPDIIEAA